jgi:hypothetical protein
LILINFSLYKPEVDFKTSFTQYNFLEKMDDLMNKYPKLCMELLTSDETKNFYLKVITKYYIPDIFTNFTNKKVLPYEGFLYNRNFLDLVGLLLTSRNLEVKQNLTKSFYFHTSKKTRLF